MKPICFPCERFMRPKKNGVYFIEGMPDGKHPGQVGKGALGWLAYKLWVGDLWHCPTCGAQTIIGVAQHPLSEHYLPDFDKLAPLANGYMVKDC